MFSFPLRADDWALVNTALGKFHCRLNLCRYSCLCPKKMLPSDLDAALNVSFVSYFSHDTTNIPIELFTVFLMKPLITFLHTSIRNKLTIKSH